MAGKFTGPERSTETVIQEGMIPTVARLLLVLESEDRGAWVIPVLPRFLEPERYLCKVALAMEEVAHSGWIQSEPETFWEAISQRRNLIHTALGKYQEILESEGFPQVETEVTDMSEEGQKHLLEEVDQFKSAVLEAVAATKNMEYRGGEDNLMVIGCTQGRAITNPHHPTSSFAAHLASHCSDSVLLLKRPPQTQQQGLKILFATDGTEASQRAARKLPQLIRPDDAEVTLLTIVNPIYLENPVIAPYVNMGAIEESYRQNAEMLLSMSRGLLESQGMSVGNAYSAMGSPGWELLEQIRQQNPDLVVVGSHNRTGGASWLLGSVSQRAVQYSGHNILVVR